MVWHVCPRRDFNVSYVISRQLRSFSQVWFPVCLSYSTDEDYDGSSLLVATLYWYISTVALPRIFSYQMEERIETLDDGTTVTRICKKEL
jgi:hypothetical protein